MSVSYTPVEQRAYLEARLSAIQYLIQQELQKVKHQRRVENSRLYIYMDQHKQHQATQIQLLEYRRWEAETLAELQTVRNQIRELIFPKELFPSLKRTAASDSSKTTSPSWQDIERNHAGKTSRTV